MDEIEQEELAELAARGQRIVILCIVLNLGLNGIERSGWRWCSAAPSQPGRWLAW
jgi:hypothetical protein